MTVLFTVVFGLLSITAGTAPTLHLCQLQAKGVLSWCQMGRRLAAETTAWGAKEHALQYIVQLAELPMSGTDRAGDSADTSETSQRKSLLSYSFEGGPPPEAGSKWAILARAWRVRCLELPVWVDQPEVTVAIVSEQENLHAIPVEVIDTEPRGDIGICTMAFSASPLLHDWLSLHRSLGVSEFHIYLPHGRFIAEEDHPKEFGDVPIFCKEGSTCH